MIVTIFCVFILLTGNVSQCCDNWNPLRGFKSICNMGSNFLFSAMQVISREGTEGAKFQLSGKGVDQDPKGIFRINEISGDVSVTRPLDREEIANYEVSAHLNWISPSVLVIYTLERVCISFWKDCSCWRLNYKPLSCKISSRTSYPLEIVNVCIFTRNWNCSTLCMSFLSFIVSRSTVWKSCMHLICEHKILLRQKEVFGVSCL